MEKLAEPANWLINSISPTCKPLTMTRTLWPVVVTPCSESSERRRAGRRGHVAEVERLIDGAASHDGAEQFSTSPFLSAEK